MGKRVEGKVQKDMDEVWLFEDFYLQFTPIRCPFSKENARLFGEQQSSSLTNKTPEKGLFLP